jgi:DNA-binding protein YbaB
VTQSKVGRKFFGKTPVSVPEKDREAWDSQAHEKSWSDAGESKALMDQIIPAFEKLVAKNAHMGLSDYLSSGEVAIRPEGNDVVVGVRIWNNEVQLIGEVSLRSLIASALNQARPDIANPNGEARALVSALVGIGRELSAMTQGQNAQAVSPNAQAGRIARSN